MRGFWVTSGWHVRSTGDDSAILPGWRAYALLPAYVALHALAIVLPTGQAPALSFLFTVSAPLLAGGACVARARRSRVPHGWIALAAAMLLWAGGMGATAANTLLLDNASGVNAISMVLFVLYGVPLLFMVASPERELWPAQLVDGALALALGGLFFAHSFAFATMTGTSAAGLISLALMFDIENLFIAIFALIRFVASPGATGRSLFGTLAVFACAYLLTAGYINHFAEDTDYGSYSDLLIDVPFVLLAALAIGRGSERAAPVAVSARLAHLVRAGSPLVLPATLLVVSGVLVPHYPALAVAGFIVATLLTGLRNILVQTRSLEEHDRLEQLARVDALTGLANRRQFDETLWREWGRARRGHGSIALLMIDIDHFKQLNDRFGHPTGDARLRDVARALAETVSRGGDLVARYGGEEFAAILPATGREAAMRIAEAMRAKVEALKLAAPGAAGIVTISIGVGHADTVDGSEPAELIRCADAALYDAKAGGRNRVDHRALAGFNPSDRAIIRR
ncbi:diguanylate cyclase [Sphingomonas sp.]|uniref:GGDEF domain-containing protein n=1 Tax=Sphingomonas sp. TaxID=28214 RepID=UPI002CE3F2F1|nr:diguanylate cyclase [Sphingomonas sp.]HWK35091.1 diguanylate cyclase [Sphingomonas sp.]